MDRLCASGANALVINQEALRHGRSCLPRHRDSVLRPDGSLRQRLRPIVRRNAMVEPIIGLIVGVSLGVYLLYTLIRPERF
jgi:K+-transporting ATPase KdpF subunit